MRLSSVAVAALLLAGCATKAEKLPVACTQGPGLVLTSLAKAPGAVAMNGTPISHCFNRDAASDDIQIVGTNLLAAAQQLGDRARSGDSRAALQLGYLVGAAERGSRRSGLGGEIVRRLEAETAVGSTRRAAYHRGHSAGLGGG